MSVISLLIVIIVATVAFFATDRLVKDQTTKRTFHFIIFGLVIIVVVLWVLGIVGTLDGGPSVRIGR